MKKVHISLIFSNLMVVKPLNTIYLLMRDFMTNFVRILGICKYFAGNRVNELRNVPRCGVVPKCSASRWTCLSLPAVSAQPKALRM